MTVLFADVTGIRDLGQELQGVAATLASIPQEASAWLALGDDMAVASFSHFLLSSTETLELLAIDLQARADGFEQAELLLAAGRPFQHLTVGQGCDAQIAPQQVDHILVRIGDLLREGGFWSFLGIQNRVTPEELAGVTRLLVGLPPPHLQAVLAALDGQVLTKWLDHARHNAPDGQQERLFARIFSSQDPVILSRMLLAASDEARPWLLENLAKQAPPPTLVAVFQDLATRTDTHGRSAPIAVGLFQQMGFYRQPAVRWLADVGRLDGLVKSLLIQTRRKVFLPGNGNFSASNTHTTFDSAPLQTMAEQVQELQDPDLSARFFVAAVSAIETPLHQALKPERSWSQETKIYRFTDRFGLLSSLAGVLAADSVRVFDALRLKYDIFGETTRIFFRELYRSTDQQGKHTGENLSEPGTQIASGILAATMGPADPGQRARFFQAKTLTSGGTYDYANAARLGFVVGSIARALESTVVTSENKWSVLTLILASARVIDPTKVSTMLFHGSKVAQPIAGLIESGQLNEMRLEHRDYKKILIEQILPRDNGRIFDGDAADEFFNSYDRVGGYVQP